MPSNLFAFSNWKCSQIVKFPNEIIDLDHCAWAGRTAVTALVAATTYATGIDFLLRAHDEVTSNGLYFWRGENEKKEAHFYRGHSRLFLLTDLDNSVGFPCRGRIPSQVENWNKSVPVGKNGCHFAIEQRIVIKRWSEAESFTYKSKS